VSAYPTTTEPGVGAAETVLNRSAGLHRRLVADAIARWVVTSGGVATILSILAILTFIGVEVLPLWQAARVRLASDFRLAEALRLPAMDEQRGVLIGLTDAGSLDVFRLSDGHRLASLPIEALQGSAVVAAARARDTLMLATADGRLIAERVVFEGGRPRESSPDVSGAAGAEGASPSGDADSTGPGGPWVALKPAGEWALGEAPRLLATSVPADNGVVVVFTPATGAPRVYASIEKRNVFGGVQRRQVRAVLETAAETTAVAVNAAGTRAYVGTGGGELQLWDLREPESPRLVAEAAATRGQAITQLTYLIGDTSVVVGDAGGGVKVWFPVRDASRSSGWRLQRVHSFPSHRGPVTAVAASPRDRSFLTADVTGEIVLRHATTARDLAKAPPVNAPVTSLVYAPKANGGAAVTGALQVSAWDISNPHPEVTLQSLFGKVWYDGYEEPAYVWQSTGGTDEFEPKLSLRPLIFGTVKGTFYALLFAVPLAVLAALYTSQFAHPGMRNLVKPVVEVMAALPSVVLGFLAGLWLAPLIEGHVPAVLAMLVVLPLGIILACIGWKSLPQALRARVPSGLEVLLLGPVIVGLVWLSWALNARVEEFLFAGSFRAWLLDSAGLRFDQRNCLVVGFAMGFAVIPIIFTISEDALTNVPRRLISASLALGATAWQTAVRVVLPTASPGIFSAIMIGFGRAVGETMIVLMATGNTPVFDWNIFTGMRTLSANIAVEIPEAPYGSTLYRVLFLAALLLFFATFAVNTVAELVRQRLRRRYQEL
jgi:phosphate transport system permease protein